MWKGKSAMANIEFGDLIQLNHLLKVKNTRYHLAYKDGTTACKTFPVTSICPI